MIEEGEDTGILKEDWFRRMQAGQLLYNICIKEIMAEDKGLLPLIKEQGTRVVYSKENFTLESIYDIFKIDNMKAVIKRVTHGKQKGQFRFILKAGNNEPIAHGETYTQKHNVKELLEKYFPLFTIEDKTK